jgi:polyisoprenoid-binding protein YceI
MRTKLWALPVAAAALAAAAFLRPGEALSADAKTWAGDTVHSFVLFRIKHLGTSWTWGRFNDFTVSLQSDAAGAALSAIEFDVKTASVDTGQAKRDQHLKNPDFFNAAEFPSITFKSKSVKPAGDGAWDVDGDLTLHGETKPISVKVTKVGLGKGMDGGPLLGLEANFTVKRSDYGMSKMVGPVGDDVAVTVAVEAAPKK